MMFAALAGLATGLIHVLSGPDHLAAVAPLALDDNRTQWKAGFQWGCGHTTGVLAVGVLLLVFREVLPVEAISAYSERIVGVALIGVGVWGVARARRSQFHRHADGDVHAHVKPPGAPIDAREHRAQHHHPALHGHAHSRLSFLMGTLHGLAGSSHLFGILPALALPTRALALAYLGGFGVGVVVAMTAFAAFVGIIASRAGGRAALSQRRLLYATSVAAVLVGGAWLVV